MKKLTALILALIVGIIFIACNNAPDYGFEDIKPWASTGFEKTVYKIEKKNGSGEIIARGELTYLLTNNARQINLINYSSLECKFELEYNNNAEQADRGKIDKINSYVLFGADSLAAYYSIKSVKLADRENTQNLSYDLAVNYLGQIDHNGQTLQGNKATLTMEGEEPRTLSVSGSKFYDNELLYFLCRAKPIAAEESLVFKMTNIFDSFINNELFVYDMSLNINKDLETFTLDSELIQNFNLSDETLASDQLKCYAAQLRISGENAGPATEMYFAVNPFEKDTKKHHDILVSFITKQYNSNLTLESEMIYTLIEIDF